MWVVHRGKLLTEAHSGRLQRVGETRRGCALEGIVGEIAIGAIKQVLLGGHMRLHALPLKVRHEWMTSSGAWWLALVDYIMYIFTALAVKLSRTKISLSTPICQIMSRRVNRTFSRPPSVVSDGYDSASSSDPFKRRANLYDAIAGNFSGCGDVIFG